jgi:hypothetical protein
MINLRSYTYALTAGVPITPSFPLSSFIAVADCDGDFYIVPDAQAELLVGKRIRVTYPEQFSRIEIRSDTTQTVTLIVGTGEVIDGNVGGIFQISASSGVAHSAVTIGVAAGLVAAGNPSRGALTIQNLGPAPIYFGSLSTVTTANGIMLDVNGTAEITHNNAVYAISATAGNDIRVMEETL